jgi:magnesium-dependent phosphatase 1
VDGLQSFEGVTFHLVRDGTNAQEFEKGLATWRKKHPEEVMEEA